MKAAVLHKVGAPFAIEGAPEPEGENVVDVRAAGINFADALIRGGMYPQMPELPYVPGSEVAGELDGRRVVAFTRGGGGFAERAALDPDWTFDLPTGASFAAGAAFLTTYLTAYVPFSRLSFDSVLVHAGSGGVGTAAIQLAKHRGATVYATASSDEKRAVASKVGADHVLAYEAIDDLRVDIVIDPVGGDVFTRSLPLLNPLGTIVAIGFAGGLWQDPSVQWLVGRNASVMGVYLGRLLKLAPAFVRGCVEELLELWTMGAIDPVVGGTFPLAGINDAFASIEQRRHVGKVVVEP
ncbi:MAG TPA: NADPH:quinone oxidoreductase family protein [Gaiellaceae bacterium]